MEVSEIYIFPSMTKLQEVLCRYQHNVAAPPCGRLLERALRVLAGTGACATPPDQSHRLLISPLYYRQYGKNLSKFGLYPKKRKNP
jgi:hypothetical protein